CMWAYTHNLPAGAKHDGLFEGGSKTARYWHPSIVKNGKKLPTTINDYGPDIFSDFALDFIRRHKDKPFFVYYPMALVHAPYWPTPDDHPADKAKDIGGGKNWRSNVEYADKIVGKLIAGLEEMGERENTLFLFVGDNGTGGNGKGQTTEMGCRVPYIANGPGLVKPVGACRELVDLTDILPTCCDVAGVKLPNDLIVDGVSFKSYLQGDLTPKREWIYEYLGHGRVVRTKRWLLEHNTMRDFGQLYDCGESRNGKGYKNVTASTDPEVVAAKALMRQILSDKPVPDAAVPKPRAGAGKKGKR
ncbi:MAG: sulfatase-like hydrolase/transferase, partial [Planctomycetales bacterium]|nr:sulfatase-like hydrolase/transferase [Planctomycetales bacterium]